MDAQTEREITTRALSEKVDSLLDQNATLLQSVRFLDAERKRLAAELAARQE
jgi:hypothetical protein